LLRVSYSPTHTTYPLTYFRVFQLRFRSELILRYVPLFFQLLSLFLELLCFVVGVEVLY